MLTIKAIVPSKVAMRKFGTWCGPKLHGKLGDKTTSTLESCVVREGLKGKGGQGMETCLKQQ